MTASYIASFLCPLFLAWAAVPAQTSEQTAIQALDAAETRRETQLAGYSVTERYSLTSSRFNLAAEMVVETLYKRGEGDSYRIVSRSGSPMLQSRVFDRLIREEGEMTRGETRRKLLAQSDNYTMRLSGETTLQGKKCNILDLTPKTENTHLLKGRAWSNTEDGSLLRIEGVPPSSPSFLTGRPTIVREYQRIGDFWLVKSSNAVSKSLLFGTSELWIHYENYHVLDGESPQ